MNGTVIRTAETIAAEINVIKAQVRQTAVMATIEIGKRLKEAKSLVPYGEWGLWLQQNVDYSERKAQNAMALAEEYAMKDPQAIADLDVTKAVMLLAVPGEEREAFVAEHQVEDISVRELKAAIEQLKAEKEKQQLTIEELMARAAEQVAPEPDRALEAEAAQLRDKLRESQDRENNLRIERDKAQNQATEMEAERKVWARDRERLEQENAGHEKTIARLTEEVKNASATILTTAAADRPETLAELEKLRAEKASAVSIASFRAAFEQMKRALGEMVSAVEQMDEVNRERYCKVARLALDTILQKFGGRQ